MSQEAYKAAKRRMSEAPEFWANVFSGKGIDLGCGCAPIGLEHYPKITQNFAWDKVLNSRHDVSSLPFDDKEFNWAHASHVLEHVENPIATCNEWMRVLTPGGWLVITVPDFNLYERDQWPSRFNPDHKSTWSIEMAKSLIAILSVNWDVLESDVKLLDAGFNPDLPNHIDQTRPPYNAECAVEIIIRKGHG